MLGGDQRQRVLQAVENLSEQPGAELHGQQLAGKIHGVADADSAGDLEHLQLGSMPADADDLGLQPLVAGGHVAHLVHEHVPVHVDGDHVAVYADHSALLFFHAGSSRMEWVMD